MNSCKYPTHLRSVRRKLKLECKLVRRLSSLVRIVVSEVEGEAEAVEEGGVEEAAEAVEEVVGAEGDGNDYEMNTKSLEKNCGVQCRRAQTGFVRRSKIPRSKTTCMFRSLELSYNEQHSRKTSAYLGAVEASSSSKNE